eukprot:TRINITY_DN12284_c0_g1_i1.p1 TRINITY_DN12284_c0_g1~~TRINITY_DN12284_c0_g1_i1.p1  ORF type:complete len:617 (+),score=139.67 TRINITY_DN12284_c0_g1_i1:64-1914(+)
MAMAWQNAAVAILVILLAHQGRGVVCSDGIVLTKVDRKIDLTTQQTKITLSLKVENKGSADVSEIILALLPGQAKQLSYVKAVVPSGKGKNRVPGPLLQVAETAAPNGAPTNASFYSVTLEKQITAGGTATLEVFMILTQLMQPFPAEISQSDRQLVLYSDNAHLLTPYTVKYQVTRVSLASSNIQSYTKHDPSTSTGKEIKYGAYDNTSPFTWSPVTLHFQNNGPFIVAEELLREIEISHWGNIYVTENYVIAHTGAAHKGSFSRLDFQMRPEVYGASAARQLRAILPPNAYSVYYRDEIGNISTSHLRGDFRKTELELEPRYPLFGGWKVAFTVGYSVYLQDFVSTQDGSLVLNITFGSPFAELVVKNLTVKVVLPEGSKDISAATPFDVVQQREVKYTYLDVTGRPVVVLTKDNVVAEHNQYFQVSYKFGTLGMLREPLLLVGAFLGFFIAYIAYVRADFTISKTSATYQSRIQQEEVVDLVQRLQKVITSREKSVGKIDASIKELANGGEVATAKTVRKAVEASIKESSRDVKSITNALEANTQASTLLPKVQGVVSREKEMVEKFLQAHTVMVDAMERKLPAKEVDSKISPVKVQATQLKAEVRELLRALE